MVGLEVRHLSNQGPSGAVIIHFIWLLIVYLLFPLDEGMKEK